MRCRSIIRLVIICFLSARASAQSAADAGQKWRSAMNAGTFTFSSGSVRGVGLSQQWIIAAGESWDWNAGGEIVFARTKGVSAGGSTIYSGNGRIVNSGAGGTGASTTIGMIGTELRWSPLRGALRPYIGAGPSVLASGGAVKNGADLLMAMSGGIRFPATSSLSSEVFVRYTAETAPVHSSSVNFRNGTSGGISLSYSW